MRRTRTAARREHGAYAAAEIAAGLAEHQLKMTLMRLSSLCAPMRCPRCSELQCCHATCHARPPVASAPPGAAHAEAVQAALSLQGDAAAGGSPIHGHGSLEPPEHTFAQKLRGLATPRVALFLLQATLMGFGMGTFESFMCAALSSA
jgi:hypothetical protein